MASHSMLTGFLGLFIARRKLWTVGVKAGIVWNFLLLKGQKKSHEGCLNKGGLLAVPTPGEWAMTLDSPHF